MREEHRCRRVLHLVALALGIHIALPHGFVVWQGLSLKPRLSRLCLRSVAETAPLTVAPLTISPNVLPLPPSEARPGFIDASNFVEAPSVRFWQQFQAQNDTSLKSIDISGKDARYWLYHLSRSAFFMAQGLTSLITSEGARAVGKGLRDAKTKVEPSFAETVLKDPLQQLRLRLPEIAATFKQDLSHIRKGVYKMPYDMSPRHRQFSPRFVAAEGLAYLREAVATLQKSAKKADTRLHLEADDKLYPPYYRHTFHYQTNGWLSSRSAKAYETSTETLFLGRQDAMQRTTLVHLSRAFGSRLPGAKPPRLLEIGCGTGRLMTFVRDNWPMTDAVASDLSPFYLEKAAENGHYWERRFAKTVQKGSMRFVLANAESMPFPDQSFDAVVSVYLFHELPPEAQDNVMKEVARVLVPGGMFVLTDSIQLGDRPLLDESIGRFESFAEPHYKAYIERDLAALARSYGLIPEAKELSSATKSLSFLKLEQPELSQPISENMISP